MKRKGRASEQAKKEKKRNKGRGHPDEEKMLVRAQSIIELDTYVL